MVPLASNGFSQEEVFQHELLLPFHQRSTADAASALRMRRLTWRVTRNSLRESAKEHRFGTHLIGITRNIANLPCWRSPSSATRQIKLFCSGDG
jgi:hypothetical protein